MQKLILKNHIDSVHREIKRFSCNLCSYNAFYKHLVKQHQKHQHKQLKTRVKRIGCDKCEMQLQHPSCLTMSESRYKGVRKSKQKQDLQENESNKLLKCNNCDFRTQYPQSLKHHVESVHGGTERFACNLCEYKSVHKHVMISHQKCQHEEKETKAKRIWCEHCDDDEKHEQCSVVDGK